MNKIAHGIVLGLFGVACFFLWGLLNIAGRVPLGGHDVPGFTLFCIGLSTTVFTTLVIVAALYCIWVWVRKADSRTPWIAFLATTTSTLVFLMVFVMVAAYLPLVTAFNLLPQK